MDAAAVASEIKPQNAPHVPGVAEADADGWTQMPPVQLHDGTHLLLYKDGAALLAAYNAIRAAKHRICLEVYIFRSDSTGRAFADLLAERPARACASLSFTIRSDLGTPTMPSFAG